MVPDAELLLSLLPEEFAAPLFVFVKEQIKQNSQRQINKGNTLDATGDMLEGYPKESHDDIRLAIAEAWAWLEREGFLVPCSGRSGNYGWMRLSRRGEEAATATDVEAYRRANILPRAQLHPRIAEKVWATFARGDYETAVFQAFKDVEVAVRAAAHLPPEKIGVPLMRLVFAPKDGRLSDMGAAEGERQARADLFAGAIGSFKNPQSHRHVPVAAPECAELLLFASHLLRIVDGLAARPAITLVWGTHMNGLTVRGSSVGPDILVGVSALLTGIDRWSQDHGRFVRDPEHYPSGQFSALRLTGRADMGEGGVLDFGHIHLNDYRLALQTQEQNINIRQPGVWRLTCAIEHRDGPARAQSICFSWEGVGQLPVALSTCGNLSA